MKEQSILYLFPEYLRELFLPVSRRQQWIQEIRLRTNRPIYIMERGVEKLLDRQGMETREERLGRVLSGEEMKDIVNHICRYSIYAYEDELRQGFLTVPGGHRIGMAGQAVIDSEQQVRTIKYPGSLNIRIAHEIRGAADEVLPCVYRAGRLRSVLIISPPGCGKTTLLRDLVRQVSDGNAYGRGQNVAVVDERSEIAGCYQGIPQNDVGRRTDVLDRCPKARGMLMLIRSMAPAAVAMDEIGEVEDWQALAHASFCGAAVLATMHGEGLADYERRSRHMLQGQEIFSCCILLGRTGDRIGVQEIYEKEEGGWKCCWQKSQVLF